MSKNLFAAAGAADKHYRRICFRGLTGLSDGFGKDFLLSDNTGKRIMSVKSIKFFPAVDLLLESDIFFHNAFEPGQILLYAVSAAKTTVFVNRTGVAQLNHFFPVYIIRKLLINNGTFRFQRFKSGTVLIIKII